MKDKYTQDTLNQFFVEFKKLPNSFKIEHVHQLLENPNAKAIHKINPHLKLLKTIIMTSAIIFVVTTLLLWVTPKQIFPKVTNDSVPERSFEVAQENINQNIEKEGKSIGDSLETLEVYEDNNNIMMGSSNEEKSPLQESPENARNNITPSKSESNKEIEEEKTFPGEFSGYNSDTDSSFIDGITLIELDNYEYTELGFLINDSTISNYSRNDDCVWQIYFTKDVYGCSLVSLNRVDTTKPNFIFVSDQNGFQSLKWKCNGDVSEKWKDEFFKSKIQELIPIVLKKYDFQDLLYSDQIFWFEPSNELFDNLPSRISNDLKPEYYNLISQSDPLKSIDTASSLSETTLEKTSPPL